MCESNEIMNEIGKLGVKKRTVLIKQWIIGRKKFLKWFIGILKSSSQKFNASYRVDVLECIKIICKTISKLFRIPVHDKWKLEHFQNIFKNPKNNNKSNVNYTFKMNNICVTTKGHVYHSLKVGFIF